MANGHLFLGWFLWFPVDIIEWDHHHRSADSYRLTPEPLTALTLALTPKTFERTLIGDEADRVNDPITTAADSLDAPGFVVCSESERATIRRSISPSLLLLLLFSFRMTSTAVTDALHWQKPVSLQEPSAALNKRAPPSHRRCPPLSLSHSVRHSLTWTRECPFLRPTSISFGSCWSGEFLLFSSFFFLPFLSFWRKQNPMFPSWDGVVGRPRSRQGKRRDECANRITLWRPNDIPGECVQDTKCVACF